MLLNVTYCSLIANELAQTNINLHLLQHAFFALMAQNIDTLTNRYILQVLYVGAV
jgi:hypothetical protein